MAGVHAQLTMRFTDPNKLSQHLERQLKERMVSGIAQRLATQADGASNDLQVTLKGVDLRTASAVQSTLRRQGWSLRDVQGTTFTMVKR